VKEYLDNPDAFAAVVPVAEAAPVAAAKEEEKEEEKEDESDEDMASVFCISLDKMVTDARS
jgi:large subunit ribosomal protein LP0